jgi:hypothetical protein
MLARGVDGSRPCPNEPSERLILSIIIRRFAP